MAEIDFKNATQVRNNFQDTVDHVHYTKNSTVITRRGKPWVMMVPLPDDDKAVQKALEQYSKISG